MIRRFFKHFIESLKSLKRNGWMTIAAISSVTLTLTLVGIFGSVIVNTTKLATDLENNVRILVYTKVDVHDDSKELTDPEDSSKTIENENYHAVYDAITALDDVESAKFSSRDEQMKQLVDRMGDTWALYQNDANPLYDAYIVDAKSPQDVEGLVPQLEKIEGVAKVRDGEEATKQVFDFAGLIRTWGIVGTALLLFMAIFLISNTIRITIISRSREIQIMRLVGAKNSYIRGPFLLEGAWVGFLGALIPAAIVYFLYRVVYYSTEKSLAQQSLSLIPMNIFVPAAVIGLIVLGIVIGALGSTISMRRYLKI